MMLVSGIELVTAACRAGIVGAFPSHNARSAEDFEQWMQQISKSLEHARRARPDAIVAPWCVNLVTHSTNERLPVDLSLVAKYQPPIVVTALGSPRPVIEVVHGYGGIVIADVINMNLARKAIAAGVDGLACVSAGAGGHTGFLSPFAFISAVREIFQGLIVVGGGIADGHGVAGAIAAGADFVYMGTRFIPTLESIAVTEYKQMVVDSCVDDLIVSAAISGTPASWLKPSISAAGLNPDDLTDGTGTQLRYQQAGSKTMEGYLGRRTGHQCMQIHSAGRCDRRGTRARIPRNTADDGRPASASEIRERVHEKCVYRRCGTNATRTWK